MELLRKKKKKKEKPRGFSSTFIFGSHFFSPVASIFSPLPPLPPCSCPFLSLRPQLLLPLFLSVYLVPGGWAVLFFCRSSGRKAKESPRQPSVYKAFCHVNKDKPFLSLTSLIPNSSVAVHPVSLDGRLCVPAIASSVCTRLRACECACLRGPARLKPCFFPRNNWFNKLPAMFHSEEVTGAKRGDGARRLIRKQSHLYGN